MRITELRVKHDAGNTTQWKCNTYRQRRGSGRISTMVRFPVALRCLGCREGQRRSALQMLLTAAHAVLHTGCGYAFAYAAIAQRTIRAPVRPRGGAGAMRPQWCSWAAATIEASECAATSPVHWLHELGRPVRVQLMPRAQRGQAARRRRGRPLFRRAAAKGLPAVLLNLSRCQCACVTS